MRRRREAARTLAIVTEAEVVPVHIGQPLFGDVCRFLDPHSLMFHKLPGFAGRALRPMMMDNNPNFASQHIWSDAMFARHVERFADLTDRPLLKLAVLALVYGSPDVAYFGISRYDAKRGT